MATAEEYAQWIVSNADKKGTPEFDTVAQAYQAAKGQPTQQKIGWGDVPIEAIKNTPKSAGNFFGGIYQAVRHPIDTVNNVIDLGAGALHNITPKPIAGFIDKVDSNNPAAQKRLQESITKADQVGAFYKDRYGSLEGVKNALATDPVGVAADASVLLTGGSTLAGKVGLTKTANALNTAAKYTNPLNAVAPAINGVGNLIGKGSSNLLGLTTGVGSENVRQAVKAGKSGEKSFIDNLTGKVPMTQVLDDAKANLDAMRQAKNIEYQNGISQISGDSKVLNFEGIDSALKSAKDAVTYKGQPVNAKGVNVVQQIGQEINKWKNLNPDEFHTPIGLDALKKKIGGIIESIPFEEKTARKVGSDMYNAVRSEITKQAPTYAETMKQYSEAADQIHEIEKALSLGNKASADAGLRKLQSLSRNNANTNYGNRLDLAKQLQAGGGKDLMPAIAGQAMNSWTARGLGGQLENMTTAGMALAHNPALFGLLPFQSPKFVGAASYGAGKGVKIASDLANRVGAKLPSGVLTPEQMRQAGLLMYQTQPKNQ